MDDEWNKPKGYNVEKVTNFATLSHEDLAEVVEVLLERLEIEVWTDTTPDYRQVILTRKPSAPSQQKQTVLSWSEE